jgi:hypothetical protein
MDPWTNDLKLGPHLVPIPMSTMPAPFVRAAIKTGLADIAQVKA